MRARRLTSGEIIFALLVIWLAVITHGPAGSLLTEASTKKGGDDLPLLILAGLVWLVSGVILVAAALSGAWMLVVAWRSRRR